MIEALLSMFGFGKKTEAFIRGLRDGVLSGFDDWNFHHWCPFDEENARLAYHQGWEAGVDRNMRRVPWRWRSYVYGHEDGWFGRRRMGCRLYLRGYCDGRSDARKFNEKKEMLECRMSDNERS